MASSFAIECTAGAYTDTYNDVTGETGVASASIISVNASNYYMKLQCDDADRADMVTALKAYSGVTFKEWGADVFSATDSFSSCPFPFISGVKDRADNAPIK